jgi:hypothetical protein
MTFEDWISETYPDLAGGAARDSYRAAWDASRDASVAAFRRSPPPDLRVIHDGAGRVTRLLLAGEVVE